MALGRGSAGKGSAEGAPVALAQEVPAELRQTWRGLERKGQLGSKGEGCLSGPSFWGRDGLATGGRGWTLHRELLTGGNPIPFTQAALRLACSVCAQGTCVQ